MADAPAKTDYRSTVFLPRTASLRSAIVDGADSVTALELEAF